MEYKCGISRDQGTLFPERVDDYIAANNPVRVIDAYVESLNITPMKINNMEEKKNRRMRIPPLLLYSNKRLRHEIVTLKKRKYFEILL
jgi:hypothetical protein